MPLEDHIWLKKTFSFAKLTRILTGVFIVHAALNALMIFVQLNLYFKLSPVVNDSSQWNSSVEAAGTLYVVGQRVLTGIFLIAAITFLIWFYRARRNVDILEVEGVQYSPEATVGWWVVPLANFVVPFRVAREIWVASNPATYEPEKPTLWLKDDEVGPVKRWWMFWLIFAIGERLGSKVYEDPETIAQFQEGVVASLVVSLLAVIAVWFAIKFIKGLYQRQEERYALIHEQNVSPNAEPELLSA
ncbi:MAG: DUF4328 domain-containing protein [Candidatus Kapaibacterium sp.]